MIKHVKAASLLSIPIVFLLFSSAKAHLALDHLKQNLDARFKDVYSTNQLKQSYKASALSALRLLQTRYSSLAGLSTIPSQKKAVDDMCQQLTQDIDNFDRMLAQYKQESHEKKSEE